MYIYIYIYRERETYMYICIICVYRYAYIYIYIERERVRKREGERCLHHLAEGAAANLRSSCTRPVYILVGGFAPISVTCLDI